MIDRKPLPFEKTASKVDWVRFHYSGSDQAPLDLERIYDDLHKPQPKPGAMLEKLASECREKDERIAELEAALNVARERLTLIASRKCGSECAVKTEKWIGGMRYPNVADRCAVCVAKDTLAALDAALKGPE